MRKTKTHKNRISVGQLVQQKDGSAILIAIVVMMVAIVLSLSLLLVSYSLFATVNKQQNMEQCKAMAQSVSRELEREITGPEVDYESFAAMKEAAQTEKSPLWFYLRFHLWQTNWPYYNKEERGHTEIDAVRSFKMGSDAGGEDTGILDAVSVKMYWESDDGAQKGDGTSLTIKVTCSKGKQKSTITSVYDLAVEENVPGYTEEGNVILASSYNAENNAVGKNEKWTFSLSERN